MRSPGVKEATEKVIKWAERVGGWEKDHPLYELRDAVNDEIEKALRSPGDVDKALALQEQATQSSSSLVVEGPAGIKLTHATQPIEVLTGAQLLDLLQRGPLSEKFSGALNDLLERKLKVLSLPRRVLLDLKKIRQGMQRDIAENNLYYIHESNDPDAAFFELNWRGEPKGIYVGTTKALIPLQGHQTEWHQKDVSELLAYMKPIPVIVDALATEIAQWENEVFQKLLEAAVANSGLKREVADPFSMAGLRTVEDLLLERAPQRTDTITYASDGMTGRGSWPGEVDPVHESLPLAHRHIPSGKVWIFRGRSGVLARDGQARVTLRVNGPKFEFVAHEIAGMNVDVKRIALYGCKPEE